ncbi:MAG: response regulator transcription factor [Ardenticatenales bacterium]|nr:response regulator transcription factor [Ardenticatenales bacterium]
MSDKIRVVLADDHDLVLEGLQARIRDMHDIEVVGAFNDGETLLEKLHDLKPDVLVLDLHMAGVDGFDVLREIRQQKLAIRVLVLTALVDGLALQKALELGADGIAMKTDPPRQTMDAIRQVAKGNVVYPQAVHNWLLRRAGRGGQSDPQALTTREEEVLTLIAEGLTNQEIATRLYVSENTVKYHVQNIYSKLKVTNRTEAARHYLDRPKF